MDTKGTSSINNLNTEQASREVPTCNISQAATTSEVNPKSSLDLSMLREAIPNVAEPMASSTWVLPVKASREKTTTPIHQQPSTSKPVGQLSGKAKHNRARSLAHRAKKKAAAKKAILDSHGTHGAHDQAIEETHVARATNTEVTKDKGQTLKNPKPLEPVHETVQDKGHDKAAARLTKRAAKQQKKAAKNVKGKAEAGQGSKKHEPKTGKRARPDDTLSPRDTGKRPKTNTSGPVVSSVSYSDACRSNDLCVAVMTEPFQDLRPDEAESIETSLEEAIDSALFGPSSSTKPIRSPSFRGKAFHSEGVLKLWCEDAYTLEWLHKTVNKINSPRAGTRLVVKRQAEIPRKVKAGMFVPKFTENSIAQLHERFRSQNPWYNIASWSLYQAIQQEDKKGIYLVLGIPPEDVVELKKRDRRVSYKIGSVYVKLDEIDSKPKSSSDVAGVPASMSTTSVVTRGTVTPVATMTKKPSTSADVAKAPAVASMTQVKTQSLAATAATATCTVTAKASTEKTTSIRLDEDACAVLGYDPTIQPSQSCSSTPLKDINTTKKTDDPPIKDWWNAEIYEATSEEGEKELLRSDGDSPPRI